MQTSTAEIAQSVRLSPVFVELEAYPFGEAGSFRGDGESIGGGGGKGRAVRDAVLVRDVRFRWLAQLVDTRKENRFAERWSCTSLQMLFILLLALLML